MCGHGSGLELARGYYHEVVAPLVGDRAHSATLLGWGSDVLGFDTERSTDHGWGPRLQVFVAPDDIGGVRAAIDAGLPDSYHGWPTRFGWDEVQVKHHVTVVTVGEWLRTQLGFDPRDGLEACDWLVTPQQLLLEVVAGEVFADGLGELHAVRSDLAWYPEQVWLWLLACQWRRLDQEEPFVGRTAEVGDELGARVLTARLCRDLMRLCLLHERRYAPYSKWLGSAFRRLEASRDVGPALERALGAGDQATREEALAAAFEAAARRHNALGLTEPAETTVRPFHSRPYRVLGSARFVEACLEKVTDPILRGLPLVGSVDQLADSTDVTAYPQTARRLQAVYAADG